MFYIQKDNLKNFIINFIDKFKYKVDEEYRDDLDGTMSILVTERTTNKYNPFDYFNLQSEIDDYFDGTEYYYKYNIEIEYLNKNEGAGFICTSYYGNSYYIYLELI